MKRLTTDDFILKAINIHGNKYDYSISNYINKRTKITIICPTHGKFDQEAGSHIGGSSCPVCMNVHRPTTEEFINKAIAIHNDKYDYSLVKYSKTLDKVKIICKDHGVFEQRPADHLSKKGCPICRESKGEREIRNILNSKQIKFTQQNRFVDCKHIKPLPFDFYLPEHNTCIEYHGRHHYEPVTAFGGKKEFDLVQIRDEIKKKYCEDNNIRLIIINYKEPIVFPILTLI